uniref:ATP synthase complex subunit 8 n=1 Tax=Aulorhynchus flavidus TaxID=240152 RepID=A7E1K9_9TELE|nr:ATP synthase F0 subunit 8 [Aulorhynchus flavidus]BAF74903.1 ATPase subunit 8 [Aulorhynchus flavidus]
MPQLNPAPWFTLMIFSWLVLLIIIPPKVTAHVFPNTLTTQNALAHPKNTWTWPWP